MINRVLIRLKVVQVIYAYYQNGGQKTATAERELAQSIDSAYSLYKTLLFIPVAWARQIRKSVSKLQRMNEHVSRRELLLADNRLLAQMESNPELDAYIQSNDFEWLFESDWMQSTCAAILESDAMEEYLQADKFDFEADKELVRRLYKEFIELIEKLQLNMVNAELDMTTLSNITQDIFRFPFVKWELKIPKDASTRWMTAFERMNLLAEKLKLSLKLKGF